MIDLSSFGAIRTAMFVRIDVPDYQVLAFSDYYRPYEISGTTYNSLGSLMSIGPNVNSLAPTDQQLVVTISGIPNSRLSEILNTRIKGSVVEIQRGIFDANTAQPLSIPGNGGSNIVGRFRGRVINTGITEDYDNINSTSSVTVQFICASTVGLLVNKISGRRTNQRSQQAWFPIDTSMNTVSALARSNINFGAPPQ
jgi:hypothetical protein